MSLRDLAFNFSVDSGIPVLLESSMRIELSEDPFAQDILLKMSCLFLFMALLTTLLKASGTDEIGSLDIGGTSPSPPS
ncbi:MAG: hypothetical protein ACP5KE_04735 [Candidatus Methanodesulfokora sp.]|nr:MAG: hypothetical protein C0200_07110 [Candidatus Korarchaeota archaeon]